MFTKAQNIVNNFPDCCIFSPRQVVLLVMGRVGFSGQVFGFTGQIEFSGRVRVSGRVVKPKPYPIQFLDVRTYLTFCIDELYIS